MHTTSIPTASEIIQDIPPARSERVFDSANEQESPAKPYTIPRGQLALWIFLSTATMLFAAFASAYLVRRVGADWQKNPIPFILKINTLALIFSSITLEIARRFSSQKRTLTTSLWLGASIILGLIFLHGQVQGWQQLIALGLYLPSNPYVSFTYIFTGLHAIHLVGGILLLFYAGDQSLLAEGAPDKLSCAAAYWHFFTLLWISILAFLTLF